MQEVMLLRADSRGGYVLMYRQISVRIEFNRRGGSVDGASEDHDVLIVLTLKGMWRPLAPIAIRNTFYKKARSGRQLRNSRG
jgi:hypothetical protein